MADVSHELGSLRFVVESPLSSKVAMFNNQVEAHSQKQLLNPFSTPDGRSSPKPTFSKDEYGKPLAGSLTEARGQKANIHVMKDMLELCQIIDSEGYKVNDEPDMRVIPFGELFNIYNYVNDKVVGILLRARKYKMVEFEGEMLFQRRDDDVPIFLVKPIQQIRRELELKIDEIKRSASPQPQATSVMLDKSAHQQKLQEAGLVVPIAQRRSKSKSRTPSPVPPKDASPAPEIVVQSEKSEAQVLPVVPDATQAAKIECVVEESKKTAIAEQLGTPVAVETIAATDKPAISEQLEASIAVEATTTAENQGMSEQLEPPVTVATAAAAENKGISEQLEAPATAIPEVCVAPTTIEQQPEEQLEIVASNTITADDSNKTDMNNNNSSTNELPTIVVEASAVFVRDAGSDVSPDTNQGTSEASNADVVA